MQKKNYHTSRNPNRSVHTHWESFTEDEDDKENIGKIGNGWKGEIVKRKDWALPKRLERESRGHSSHRHEGKNDNPFEAQYKQNQKKIENLSIKLQELYQHFQTQTKKLEDGKRKVQQLDKIVTQNHQLEQDIRKVRQLLQSSLLQFQKVKLAQHFS